MTTLSRLLYFLGCVGLSFSTTNKTEESWAKLEISPRAIASMPFLNYRVNIYESSGGLKTVDAKDRKYYYAPISLLDPQSAVSGFNNATREAEMRFRIHFWTDSVEKDIFNYLTKVVGVATSIHQVHVIPFEKVILVSTQETVNYRVHKEWIQYTLNQYLGFRIICDTLDFCSHLAEQMRFNPEQFAHLKLQFTLDSQRSKSRETVIRIENIVSGSMFSELDQQLPNSKEVYLTAADTNRLLSETVTNVLAETFSDDEILQQSAESLIYKRLEKFIVSGKIEINEQSKTMWDSVFWDQDNYRPDRSSKEISEVHRNSVHDAQQKMAETFSKSEKNSNDIDFKFKEFGFKYGFTKENTDSNSKEKEEFLKLMRESKDHVQWEGEKFVPKPMQLSRVNLAQIRNAQNFRDIRTQVTYSQSVLSTTIQTPIPSNAQSLELFVTESKFSDTAVQLLQKIADLENRTLQAQQAMTVQLDSLKKEKRDKVYFELSRSISFTGKDTYVPFSSSYASHPGATSTAEGYFIVPVTGTYFLTFHALCDENGQNCYVQMKRNGQRIAATYTTSGRWMDMSMFTVAHLNACDRVGVWLLKGTLFDDATKQDEHYTKFSGFLI